MTGGLRSAVACVLALGIGACGGGGEAPADQGDRCEALAAMALIDFDIVSSVPVLAHGDRPAHCRVRGTIDTEATFELLLPVDWNGRFMMGRRGGTSRLAPPSPPSGAAEPRALERGYATVGTTGGPGAAYPIAEATLSIIRHYYERAAALTPESLPTCDGDIAGRDCLTTAQRSALESP
jgi:hypothetical protein